VQKKKKLAKIEADITSDSRGRSSAECFRRWMYN